MTKTYLFVFLSFVVNASVSGYLVVERLEGWSVLRIKLPTLTENEIRYFSMNMADREIGQDNQLLNLPSTID